MLKRRKQQAEGISQIFNSGLAILPGAYLRVHKISTFLAITQLEIASGPPRKVEVKTS